MPSKKQAVQYTDGSTKRSRRLFRLPKKEAGDILGAYWLCRRYYARHLRTEAWLLPRLFSALPPQVLRFRSYMIPPIMRLEALGRSEQHCGSPWSGPCSGLLRWLQKRREKIDSV